MEQIKRISIKEIRIHNYKNIRKGIMTSYDLKRFKEGERSRHKENHILGIYGQNGSGKTAVVEVLDLLKCVLSGKKIKDDYFNGITELETDCSLGFVFYMDLEGQYYLVDYQFRLNKENKCVTDEKLMVKKYTTQWGKYRTLIESRKHEFFLNKKVAQVIKKQAKEDYFKLNIYREFVDELPCSYLFYEKTLSILNNIFEKDELELILSSLHYYGKYYLIVLKDIYNGLNHMLLFNERFDQYQVIDLLNIQMLDFDTFEMLRKNIDKMNAVLKEVVPSLYLDIKVLNKEFINEIDYYEFMIVCINNQITISLKHESNGIKKIISIINAVIMMFNYPFITLVIDELDSGVFEYLLGELLKLLDESSKGDLIFTSHNLRALERLGKESVVFTSIDPFDKFIRLNKVRSSGNLRDYYLRNIVLKDVNDLLVKENNPKESLSLIPSTKHKRILLLIQNPL